MSTKRAVGLESIFIGPVRTDSYAMPTTLQQIANTVEDTAKLTFDVPESIQFFTEESDDVDIEIHGSAKKGIEFATYDMDNNTFVLAFGGSTGATLWRAPVTSVLTTQRAVRITTKSINGYKMQFDIPNMSIKASGELKFSKKAAGQIAFQGTVMKCGSTSPMVRRFIT